MSKNEQLEAESTNRTEEKANRRAHSVVQAPKEPTRIYLGPNLPGGRLTNATTFRGGIPDYLTDLLEGLPEVETLIVPVAEMASVQSRIRTPGTPEYQAYQSLQKSGKGQ